MQSLGLLQSLAPGPDCIGIDNNSAARHSQTSFACYLEDSSSRTSQPVYPSSLFHSSPLPALASLLHADCDAFVEVMQSSVYVKRRFLNVPKWNSLSLLLLLLLQDKASAGLLSLLIMVLCGVPFTATMFVCRCACKIFPWVCHWDLF